ncbi:FAD-dependent oxidoreductase [Nonomuraea sp. NPDC050202]|jgi:2-polyprenyl-6-methoxyphenol hydroxylase-like FAD-dependent oxidoreductase|uniref:FAD-dependent oxidoreductase n=1 Tax=Nonomuraea sp. NPDC050202 TaxID=3155035 RepID=UPI0033D2693E
MDTDVIIVGAGPTGLLLAGDLAQAGVTTTVLERRVDDLRISRAFAVHARTLEVLDMRGLADQVIATGNKVAGLTLWDDVTAAMTRLPSTHNYMLVTPQYNIERALRERALAHGARLLTGHEMAGLRQDGQGVDLEVREPDGQLRVYRSRYVVGADGHHSSVREAIGLPFPGGSVARSVILADVRLAHAPQGVLTVNSVREGFVFMAPFGDGWYRIIGRSNINGDLPDDAPVDLEELRWLTRKARGTDFGMHDPRWLSRFHSEERQAPRYRVGRVFIAGDAAHVHSPAGGQGMNTGLQDVANLSWKLAAAVHGTAPAGLLDSYERERHPVGRQVLRTSGILMRLALLRSPISRAIRNAVSGAALRTRAVERRVALGALSGIGIRYPAPSHAHHLTGRRAPDLPLADGPQSPQRLFEALRAGRFVLVVPPGTARISDPRADVVTAGAAAGPTVLVRPDGYVAWAGQQPDRAAVREALDRWCGTAQTGLATP